MATRASLGVHIHEAFTQINDLLEEHSPGHMERIRALTVTGSPPVRTGTADELARIVAYQSEQNKALAELVAGLLTREKNRERAAARERQRKHREKKEVA